MCKLDSKKLNEPQTQEYRNLGKGLDRKIWER